jgi:hypothetical protein
MFGVWLDVDTGMIRTVTVGREYKLEDDPEIFKCMLAVTVDDILP